MTKENDYLNLDANTLGPDALNFKDYISSLQRHRLLIAKVCGASVLASIVFAFIKKPIWQGDFQIVLEDKQKSSLSRGLSQLSGGVSSRLADLSGASGGGNNRSINTEMKILESPSVLRPVFEFYKAEKEKKGENLSGLRYQVWASALSIQNPKRTSVLNVVYTDTDKELIKPVVDLISSTYQAYSGRDRERGLSQGISYLEDQIPGLLQIANQSMKKAISYGIDNGLGFADSASQAQSPSTFGGGRSRSSNNLQEKRIIAMNQLNALEDQLSKAKSTPSTSEWNPYQVAIGDEQDDKLEELKELQVLLEERSQLLEPSNKIIQSLKMRIGSMKSYYNKKTIDRIEAKIIDTKSLISAYTRENDVLLKHRELVRAALRDERTLTEIENKLQALRLDQARQTTPWELISAPNVLDYPIAPSKRRIVGIGLIGGLFLGSCSALFIDRNSGIIFSIDELKREIPYPLLQQLSTKSTSEWRSSLALLAKSTLNRNSASSLALVPIGDVGANLLIEFEQKLREGQPNQKILLTRDLLEAGDCNNQILIATPGVVTKNQLISLKRKVALQGTSVVGWVLLDPDLNL